MSATPAYDAARVENAKTLGDAYAHVARDHGAFVAGAQYALDRLLGDAERLTNVPLGYLSWLDTLATDTLERAKAGEPQ